MDFLDELGLHQLWEKIKGLISSQTSNYAVDSAVVHISGAETVVGAKTFSGGVTVANGAVISGGAEVSGRFAISSGGADFEIPSGDPNDATKFLRGDGAWAEITSAASADTITTTLPISLGGTGESTKNMAVSALFNDNVGSNAAYLLGATSTFASAGYVDANDAKALLGITQSDIVSMIGTEPVASASAATDAASLGGVAASNYVTLNTDQNITGVKTFVGQKKIKFQQSEASDKLGFTLYNSAGVEQGYLEYNPTNKINDASLMTLGNYASAAAGVSYVGFRKYSNITGSAGAYNLLTPLIADAKTPFSLTTTYSTFFLPLGVTDGTSMVVTDSSGVLDISPILPSGYTLPPATTTSIGGVAIGSGLDVTSTGDISVDSAYVSSAALDAVSSGGYIVTSDAAAIIADQISSGGYVTSTGTVASAGTATNASSLGGSAASVYAKAADYLALSGGTLSGNITVQQSSANASVYVDNGFTDSKAHKGALHTNTNGEFGIYDTTNAKWLLVSDSAGNVTMSGNAATATTAGNVTGTVAIDHGGTGQTTRLAAIKALTNENVGTNATHILGLKSDWSKVGYFSIDEAKTLLGLGTAAYTSTGAFAAAGHTHSYLPLGGGTLTGALTISRVNPYLYFVETDWSKGTPQSSGTSYQGIYFSGSNAEGGHITYHYGTDKNSYLALAAQNLASAAAEGNTTLYLENALGTKRFRPATNNDVSLGHANYKWSTVYATTFSGALAGNATTASSCTGNAATASSCTGNAATATKASSCTGNAATASSCTGHSVSVTCSCYRVNVMSSAVTLPAGGTWAFVVFGTSNTSAPVSIEKYGVSAGGTTVIAKNVDYVRYNTTVYCTRKT